MSAIAYGVIIWPSNPELAHKLCFRLKESAPFPSFLYSKIVHLSSKKREKILIIELSLREKKNNKKEKNTRSYKMKPTKKNGKRDKLQNSLQSSITRPT